MISSASDLGELPAQAVLNPPGVCVDLKVNSSCTQRFCTYLHFQQYCQI